MSDIETLHAEKVADVAKEFRQKGYKVFVEPKRKDLQKVLGNYRPDLFAATSTDKVVVEVKVSGERFSADRWKVIADRVRAKRGWRFLLVSVTPESVVPENLPATFAPLTSSAIKKRIKSAESLVAINQVEAGFILLWTALEGLVRRKALNFGGAVERLSVPAVAKYLYSLGDLSHEQHETILELNDLRSSIVHGMQPTGANLRKRVGSLLSLVQELDEWSESKSRKKTPKKKRPSRH